MYRGSTKKVSESTMFRMIIILFASLAFLYFPADPIKQQSISQEQPSANLSAKEMSEEAPAFPEANTLGILSQADISYCEPQAEEISVSPEQQINLYIDEIVSKFYPELDPITIQAIVYNESHYIPDAINSSSGTMGLMQISPKWHTERALSLGVTNLLDAYGNILVGCDILSEVIGKTGSLSYALDVFAGGYDYADAYVTSVSPAREHILKTVSMIESGVICF